MNVCLEFGALGSSDKSRVITSMFNSVQSECLSLGEAVKERAENFRMRGSSLI